MKVRNLLAVLGFCLLGSFVHAQEEKAVRIQMTVHPVSLNPIQQDSYAYAITLNTVATLLRYDENGKLIYGAANEASVSDDGMVFRFKLRDDLKWSDGKPVTIDDYVFGFLSALDHEEKRTHIYDLVYVKGALEYWRNEGPREKVGIRKEGDELVVELEYSDPNFADKFASGFMAPKRAEFGKTWDIHQPTSGRYVIRSYDKTKSEILLEPNPYNRVEGQLPILYKIVSNTEAKLLFDQGKLDIIQRPNVADNKEFIERGLIKTYRDGHVLFLRFETEKPPFNDIRWRRAVLSAIDRKAMVVADWMRPATSVSSSYSEAHTKMDYSQFQTEIEYVRGLEDKPTIRLQYIPDIGNSTFVVQRVVQDLKAKLGLNVELVGSEWKGLDKQKEDLVFASAEAHIFRREGFLGSHQFDIGDEALSDKFTSLLFELKVLDSVKFDQAKVEAENILVDQAASVPLIEADYVWVVSPRIKNFTVGRYKDIPFHELRKE